MTSLSSIRYDISNRRRTICSGKSHLPEVNSNPSPLQFLHQARLLHLLPALAERIRGTLGVLLDAKRRGLIVSVAPILDTLEGLPFRLAPGTRRRPASRRRNDGIAPVLEHPPGHALQPKGQPSTMHDARLDLGPRDP